MMLEKFFELAEKGGDWMEFAKELKQHFIKTTDLGEVPPTIIAEKDGQVFCMAIAPTVDRMEAFKAAEILRRGANADTITFLLDARFCEVGSKEELEELRKKWPDGSMQKAVEQGMNEDGKIVECLTCHRADESGQITMQTLPYTRKGKEIVWQEEKRKALSETLGNSEAEASGLLPDTMRKIMSQKSISEEYVQLREFAQASDFSEERCFFHTARAAFNFLHHEKFFIIDAISAKHPEWIDVENKTERLLLKMANDGTIPQVAVVPLLKVITTHIGKETLGEEMSNILMKYKDRLGGIFKDAFKRLEPKQAFVEFSIIINQELLSFVDDRVVNKVKKFMDKLPIRVKVWNGDQSEFLGHGKWVANVTVYAKMTDTGLISPNNPEEKPDEEGYQEIPNNPKIVLDDGKVVYGCQVWFEPDDIQEQIKKQDKEEKSKAWTSHSRNEWTGHGYNFAKTKISDD